MTTFRVDDRIDRDHASDGASRYGAYLRQHRERFYDDPDGPPAIAKIRFALAAWQVAMPPIMSPGYVCTHGRVQDADVHWDDDLRAAIAVQLAGPAPSAVDTLASRWRGWTHDHFAQRWSEPYDNDRLTVLTVLTVRVPLDPTRLPTPKYLSGTPDTTTSKRAVSAICRQLNEQVDTLIIALNASRRS